MTYTYTCAHCGKRDAFDAPRPMIALRQAHESGWTPIVIGHQTFTVCSNCYKTVNDWLDAVVTNSPLKNALTTSAHLAEFHVSTVYGIFVYVGHTIGVVVDTDRGCFLLKHSPDWTPKNEGYFNLNAASDDVYDAIIEALNDSIVLTPTGEARLRIRRHVPPPPFSNL